MPGTGKGMYTGAIASPNYYTTSGGHRIVGSNAREYASEASKNEYDAKSKTIGKYIADAVPLSNGNNTSSNNIDYETLTNNFASSIGDIITRSNSDYADYVRDLMEVTANNTAQSQANAREQMAYQKASDEAAMAWSAAEAQKNRDYQERLSNTAHQREVRDLIAAGLNPILSANNGAYTGSGATGQAFSSSGAMGNVDMSGAGSIGQLFSTTMNTAAQAYLAGIYTDAQKYQSDMAYASSKLAAQASIYNNHNTNSANKAITQMNNQTDIQKANINASATLGSAATYANASMYGADQAAAAQRYGANISASANRYSADQHYKGIQYEVDNNIKTNPAAYVANTAKDFIDIIGVPESLPENKSNDFKFGGNTYKNMMR